MVPGLTPDEHKSLLLSIGTHRKQRALDPVAVGELLTKAEAAGATGRQLANAVGVASTDVIRRFIALGSLDPSVKPLVGWGKAAGRIAFANAAEIARLPTTEHMAAAKAILEFMLSNAEVEELIQVRLRSGKSIDAAIADTLRRRPHIERHYLFVGQLSPPAATVLAALPDSERLEALRQVTRSVFPGIAGTLQANVSGDRITLFSTEDVQAALGDDFDSRLSNAIEGSIGG